MLADLKKCINLKIPSRVPCFPLGLDFDIYDAGFTHRQYREDPEVMVKVGLRGVNTYDYDWVMVHPDDLIEYENIGIEIKYDGNIPPAVKKYLPADESTLRGLKLIDNPANKGRMALHLEGIKNLKKELNNKICLTGRIAAPFSSVALILGIEPTLLLMLEEPKLLKKYMDFFLEFNNLFAQAQLENGADAIWLGDCVATSNFISPKQYEDFAAEYADESSRFIQKKGGIVFYHGCEKSVPHLEIMAKLSFDTINIGEDIDIGIVKKAIGNKKCIMGNLDTINVLQPSSHPAVEREVKTIVEEGKVNGGYIFCTGEGIPYNTPRENVRAMVRAVKKFGRY